MPTGDSIKRALTDANPDWSATYLDVEKYYTEQYNNHLNYFIEKTRFQNIYNRLIMYDSNEFHRANSYYVGSEEETRLTLVYFIGGIKAGRFPLNRIKYEEYDSFIDYRLGKEK